MEKRGLTKDNAAAYLALEPSGFDKWVRDGLLPGPIPGTRRWDKKAIDAALDKASGLSPTIPADPLDEWLREKERANAS